MLLKQSTSRNVPVLVVESADHITGLTGATLTVTASKDGGTFATITPTVTELSGGWYNLALTSTHSNTLGALALHVTATSADPTDVLLEVVADLPGASVSSVTGAVGSVTGNVGGNVVGSVASVTAGVTVSTNSDKTGYSLTQSFPTNFASLSIDTGGVVKANLAQILGTALTETAGQIAAAFKKLFNVASPVFTAASVNQTGDAYARLGAPAGASVSADVAAVKAVLPSALTSGGNIKADALALNGSTTAAANLAASAASIGRGTVGSSATTTSIPTSALTPSASVSDEFAGRTIIFDADTSSTELRGQAATISASDATGTLTVSALTTAPASGDTFSIV